MLCIFGGVVGVTLAIVVSYSAAELANWPVSIEWQVVGLALLFSAVIGVFFGFYPARKAANQDPIEALRYE